MSTQRALLGVYGLVGYRGHAVARRAGTRTLPKQLLPGTGRRRGVVSRARTVHVPDGDSSQADPDLRATRTEPNAARALRELNSSVRDGGETLSVPELSRLVYGVGALIRVNDTETRGGSGD